MKSAPPCRCGEAPQQAVVRRRLWAARRGADRRRCALARCCIDEPANHHEFVQVVERQEHSVRGRLLRPLAPVDAVAALTGVGVEAARELLSLGACYLGEEIKGQDGKVVWRRFIHPHPHRATSEDPAGPPLPAGALLRAHPRPKRFPACHQTHWPSRLLHLDPDLAVVNKPADLPCMPHESNAVEEVAACASRGLAGLLAAAGGEPGSLEVGHRLDQWTTGVLVLTRHKEANRAFKAALQDKQGAQMTKLYRALTWRPAPLGEHTHWMYDGPFSAQGATVLGRGRGVLPPRGPRLLSGRAHAGWKQCTLRVLSSQPLAPAAAARWLQASFGGLPADDAAAPARPAEQASPAGWDAGTHTVHEAVVELVTGRTHQIRAQLAALRCPLVGDAMYSRLAGFLVDADTGVVEDEAMIRRIENLPVLSGPIGLHAWRLRYRKAAPAPGAEEEEELDDKAGRALEFCAPAPWD